MTGSSYLQLSFVSRLHLNPRVCCRKNGTTFAPPAQDAQLLFEPKSLAVAAALEPAAHHVADAGAALARLLRLLANLAQLFLYPFKGGFSCLSAAVRVVLALDAAQRLLVAESELVVASGGRQDGHAVEVARQLPRAHGGRLSHGDDSPEGDESD